MCTEAEPINFVAHAHKLKCASKMAEGLDPSASGAGTVIEEHVVFVSKIIVKEVHEHVMDT